MRRFTWMTKRQFSARFVIRGRPKKIGPLDVTYSGYAFRSPTIRRQIIARGQGAIRANIGQAELGQVLCPSRCLVSFGWICGGRRSVTPLVFMEVDREDTIMTLVRSGLGATILPDVFSAGGKPRILYRWQKK